ncbi:MAG: DUF1501 domain-containing protein [Phycisphaerales bacterium]|nr:DUF1501 domain-containing protein [Phycisphaerales bacterium]
MTDRKVHHCGRFEPVPMTRRDMLRQCAGGFGMVALGGLLADRGFSQDMGFALHHAPRAKNIIFLYMDGGPSQVDTFDPKPRLSRESGNPFPMKMEPTQFEENGNTLGSPWKFKQHGESGIPVSDLFPNVATCVDELCVIRSMTSNFTEHTGANYFLHTGHGLAGRPSMGAWSSYGLGSERSDLPGFVVLNGGLVPPGGIECFGNAFLPATHQGSIFLPNDEAVANIRRQENDLSEQERKLDLVRSIDAAHSLRTGGNGTIESAIQNHELAFRMQWAVPELMDLAGETAATKELYGLEDEYEPARIYGRQCLLARRLVERGVRFIELTCPGVGTDRWDQHNDLKNGHEANARAVDRGIAGLLKDLRLRGMLDETLVIWSGEFGRTPFAQGSDGRDHNPHGFTIWMAGGGVRGGMVFGATDEFGYRAVENPLEIHDLHATMLHLLGIDHERLVVEHGGRAMRLTDVHGHVVKEIIA